MPRIAAVAIIVLTMLTASCAGRETRDQYGYAERVSTDAGYATATAPPMDSERTIARHDCRGPFDWNRGNLLCM